MSVNGGVTSCASESFALPVLDVFSLGSHILLGESEINDEDPMSVLAFSNGEIVWLDISMDDASGVNVFDAFDHLIGAHEHSFERELLLAFVEQIFQRSAEEVHDHDVFVAFNSVVDYIWDGLCETA
jgi:hypothetical protein